VNRARLQRVMLVVGTSLGLTACRTPAPLQPLSAGDPRPEAWVSRLATEVASRQALRGHARLAVDAAPAAGRPLRLRSKQRLVVARPAQLRVEVEGWLGTTAAVLTVDDGRYAFFQAEDRHFESGPAHDGLLYDVVGLDLTPSEAVDVLLGGPRLVGSWRISSAWGDENGGLLVHLQRSGAAPASLEFDADARLVRWRERDEAGHVLWEAAFDDYVETAGMPFARRVSLSLGEARAVIALSDVELNPALSEEVFRLAPIAAAAGPGPEGG
jgi:outer membrane biogenesis lipoprotein LolB